MNKLDDIPPSDEQQSDQKRDDRTQVSELRQLVAEFVKERDWEQFHSPKNLSMSIAIEAAELMEHFQWISREDSANLTPGQRLEVSRELADVVCYVMAMANSLNIDISNAVFQKMKLNREKYPPSEFKGRFGFNDPDYDNRADAISNSNEMKEQ